MTTHVGSLPRPDGLIELMFAKAEGETVDSALLDQKTQEAVIEVVNKQEKSRRGYRQRWRNEQAQLCYLCY